MAEPGGLPSMGSHRVGHDWSDLAAAARLDVEKAMAPHSSTLAWKIPWMEEPGGLQSMGSLRVGHDWATSLSCTGEGNGNPLRCSCLENPRDGGAWWAAVYGVAQSWTRLKWLSSKAGWRWERVGDKWRGGCLSVSFWGNGNVQKLIVVMVVVVVFSLVKLFVTPWTAACQALLSFTLFWVCSNSCPLSWWCHPSISSFVTPFCSCRQSFPASGSFPVSQLFALGGQRIGASALASSEYSGLISFRIDWFDLLAVQGALRSLL